MGLLGKRTSVVRISPLAVAALCAALLFPAIRIIFLPAYLLPAIPLLKSSDGNIPELLIELLFTLPALLLGIIALISIRRQRPHIQGENYALVGITLSSIATILCFIGFIESVTEGHDNASRLERCMNNQRQLAYAIVAYAQDHDDHFPASFNELDIELQNLRCPEFEVKTWSGIGYNNLLFGRKYSHIASSNAIITTADSRDKSGIINKAQQIDTDRHCILDNPTPGLFWRYPRGAVVSFLDGHMDYIKSSEAAVLK